MTFYHVAPANYQRGDDLLCWDELEAAGYDLTWKYEGDPVDTDVVCLFETEQEAHDFISTFLPDGQLLQINIPIDADNVRITRVDEGYPAIIRSIPAAYIS